MPCTHYDILSFTFRNHHTQNTRTKQEKPQFSAALKSKTGIVERGSHEELMALSGEYKKLYEYQFRE